MTAGRASFHTPSSEVVDSGTKISVILITGACLSPRPPERTGWALTSRTAYEHGLPVQKLTKAHLDVLVRDVAALVDREHLE